MRIVVRLGALWLLAAGLLLLFPAGLALFFGYVAGPWAGPCHEYEFIRCDDAYALLAVGLIVVGVSVAHVAAFVGIWARRPWGRWLGVLLILPALGGLVVVAISPSGWVESSELMEPGGWMEPGEWTALGTALVPFLGYGLTALGLLFWYPSDSSEPSAPGRESLGRDPAPGRASSHPRRHRPAIFRRGSR